MADSNIATITNSNFDTDRYGNKLKCVNFGFSVPSNAQITGVLMTINQNSYAGTGITYSAQLTDTSGNAAGTGATTLDNSAIVPSAYYKYNHGGLTDLWGCALTPAWVNDADFGVIFQHKSTGVNYDIYVSYVRGAVFYTLTGQQMLKKGMW